ncbi:tetratricopeptide repeat protein [bacterium]|nr:tetratricopeptide repeat protein [bacterium]MBP9807905.1 tetratricopeptide repeat protein [bacterium]
MASTSQISNSMHSNRRRNSVLLMGFVLGGVSLVVVPGVYFVCQNSAQRSELCGNLGEGLASLSHQTSNISTSAIGNLFKMTATSKSSTNPEKSGASNITQNTAPSSTVAKGEMVRHGVTASNVKLVDEAVKLLLGQIEANPKDPSLHNRLGLIYAELGELSQAENQFKQAIAIARAGVSESKQAVVANQAIGQLTLASESMLKGSQAELELSTAHSNLARVYEKLGQQSKVVAQLEQLNQDVRINGNLAQSLGLSAGKAATSRNTVKSSAEIVDGMAKAEALMQAHMLPQAMAQWKQVLAIDPSIAEAHEKLGKAALSSGNIFLATQELKQAAQLEPDKATVHASLGICYQCRNKNQEAIEEFNKALAIDPSDALTAFNLGNAFAAQGNNTDARRLFQQAIKLKPEMAVAHNNLATVLSFEGQYDQAIEQFEHTLSLAPNMASAHYGLGLARFNKHDYTNAAHEFRIALQINPNLIDAHSKIELCQRLNGKQFGQQNSDSNLAAGNSNPGLSNPSARPRSAASAAYNPDSGSNYTSGSRASSTSGSGVNIENGRRLSMIGVSGDQVPRPRQRKVTMSSSIDEAGNRNLAQRLN